MDDQLKKKYPTIQDVFNRIDDLILQGAEDEDKIFETLVSEDRLDPYSKKYGRDGKLTKNYKYWIKHIRQALRDFDV